MCGSFYLDRRKDGVIVVIEAVHEPTCDDCDRTPAQRTPQTVRSCEWRIDDYGGDSQHETQCGHAFEFTDGLADDNGFRFCPYCGGTLVEMRTVDLPEGGR